MLPRGDLGLMLQGLLLLGLWLARDSRAASGVPGVERPNPGIHSNHLQIPSPPKTLTQREQIAPFRSSHEISVRLDASREPPSFSPLQANIDLEVWLLQREREREIKLNSARGDGVFSTVLNFSPCSSTLIPVMRHKPPHRVV